MLASPWPGKRFPTEGDASIPSPRPLLPRPYATQAAPRRVSPNTYPCKVASPRYRSRYLLKGLSLILCHDLGGRLGGPVEGMGLSVPFRDKGHQPFCQMIQVGEVTEMESFALEHAEPLFDLVHPGTMHEMRPMVAGEMLWTMPSA